MIECPGCTLFAEIKHSKFPNLGSFAGLRLIRSHQPLLNCSQHRADCRVKWCDVKWLHEEAKLPTSHDFPSLWLSFTYSPQNGLEQPSFLGGSPILRQKRCESLCTAVSLHPARHRGGQTPLQDDHDRNPKVIPWMNGLMFLGQKKWQGNLGVSGNGFYLQLSPFNGKNDNHWAIAFRATLFSDQPIYWTILRLTVLDFCLGDLHWSNKLHQMVKLWISSNVE